jgi:HK97 family phage major capsid protein/HK97 family phage prohead protease
MLKRAYSVLEIRAIDEDKREIHGIATTPSVDSYGDIVEPKGAEFTLPIPFLWQHRSEQPIGHVTRAKVTKEGIEVVVKLVSTDEPGTLKDRLDEAWQSIKLKLVRGLSIGFSPIEYSRIEDTYSYRFIKWAWRELSAVTIPANQEATITAIKSIDTAQRAASGQLQRGVVHLKSAGASASRKSTAAEEAISMNIQEQIKAFEAKRAASAARMEAIMAASAEKGVTLDEAESEEYDTLALEVKSVDSHLARLKTMEASAVSKATRIVTPADDAGREQQATALRGTSVIAVEKKLAKGVGFARLAGCLAHTKGNKGEALEYARQVFPEYKPLHEAIRVLARMGSGEELVKAAVAAGTSTDTTWAAPLVQFNDMAQDFIEFLRPQTIVGKITNLRKVPFNIRMPRQTNGGTASWVGEGKPKPVSATAFDNVTLRFTKLATIAVITEELARFSTPSAEMIIRDTLAGAIIQQMDADFVDPDNAGTTDVKPASITNGVTAIASSGNTEAAVRSDIQSVFAPFIAANLTPVNGVWIMSATTALALSLMVNTLGQSSFPGITMTGGTFWGMPVIVSESAGVTDGSADGHIVILANASDILLADDGQVTIDVSREASLQMDSAPTDPPSAATVFVSLWQQNMIGIKAERFVNWVKARAQAVQYISSVNWGQELS